MYCVYYMPSVCMGLASDLFEFSVVRVCVFLLMCAMFQSPYSPVFSSTKSIFFPSISISLCKIYNFQSASFFFFFLSSSLCVVPPVSFIHPCSSISFYTSSLPCRVFLVYFFISLFALASLRLYLYTLLYSEFCLCAPFFKQILFSLRFISRVNLVCVLLFC